MKLSLVGPLLLVLLLSACGASAVRSGDSTDRNRITREEIEAVDGDVQSAYDVIQRLRPRWLSVRRGQRSLLMGEGVAVYLNSSRLGGLDSLRQIQPGGVTEMEYLDAAKASATLSGIGSEHITGAIVIRTTESR